MLASLLDRPIDFFAECDRLASVPLSASERNRLENLEALANSTGLGGKDRGEYILLSRRAFEERMKTSNLG